MELKGVARGALLKSCNCLSTFTNWRGEMVTISSYRIPSIDLISGCIIVVMLGDCHGALLQAKLLKRTVSSQLWLI